MNTKGKIIFADKFLPMIRDGRKITTVRAGKRDYHICDVYDYYNVDETDHGYLYIICKYFTTFGELTEKVAQTDGFNSLAELKGELLQFYPDLKDDSIMTVIRFVEVEDK